MARIVREDFEKLKDFVNDYSLSHLLKEDGFVNLISTCHKKYFGYLTIIAELKDIINDKELSFLLESNSDIATSLFHLFSGSYKSSKLILRSSIETFLKGFSITYINDIEKESSIYKMFNRIRALPYFNLDFTKVELNTIHFYYKELCKDVHSADEVNMEKISALNLFPKYSQEEANYIIAIFVKLIPCYVTLLCHKKNEDFHKIHHINKEIILNSINKVKRPTINNISE